MSLSQLAVKLGFDVDERSLKNAERGINNLNDSVKQLGRQATIAFGSVTALVAATSAKGSEQFGLDKALGLDNKSLAKYESAAKKLGGSLSSTFAMFRSELDAQFEGAASTPFERYIGRGVTEVEGVLGKLFTELEGKSETQKRGILSQLGISGTDQNVFLEGQEAFNKALATSKAATLQQNKTLNDVFKALTAIKETLEVGVVNAIAENSRAILEALSVFNNLAQFATDHWEKLFVAFSALKVALVFSAKRAAKKLSALDTSQGMRQTALLTVISNNVARILARMGGKPQQASTPDRGKSDKSSKKPKVGGKFKFRGVTMDTLFNLAALGQVANPDSTFNTEMVKPIVKSIGDGIREVFGIEEGKTLIGGDLNSVFERAQKNQTELKPVPPQSNITISIDARGANPTETQEAVKNGIKEGLQYPPARYKIALQEHVSNIQ